MRLDDFDYHLPPELIAQQPAAQRSGSRLLWLDGRSGRLEDKRFVDLLDLVQPNDLLVFNDTRVIKARVFGTKSTGGRLELLVERILDDRSALAQIRASKSPRAGSRLQLPGNVEATVVGREGEFFRIEFDPSTDIVAYLEQHGEVPLPPYIDHGADDHDADRYQTVYAKHPGAVAAPTAGLHFDDSMLTALRAKSARTAFVTLHVGAGTFQPVRVDDVRDHLMHSERYHVPVETVEAIHAAKARDARVIAVGTTSLRALEASAADGELRAGYGDTNLFIVPGYRFRVVDRLVTNFHLPKSTLLMLVSAFAGMDNIRRAYAHAIEARYRFFSYGDAMLIERGA